MSAQATTPLTFIREVPVIFLIPCNETTGYLELRHDRFFSHHFQLTVHSHNYVTIFSELLATSLGKR
jgi:hypothetical protein